MKYFINSSCEYAILAEDDVIFAENWFEIILTELERTEKLKMNDWLMCKLFSGYKFFDNDWLDMSNIALILKLVFYSIILSIFSITVYYYVMKHPKKKVFTKAIIFLFFLNSLTQMWFYNSTSVDPFGDTTHYYWTGFGCVSVLYPNKSLHLLSDFLSNVVLNYINGTSAFFKPKDLLIDWYRKVKHFRELSIEPSIVQHTGLHSSLMVKDISQVGYRLMYKSFSFVDDFKLLKFNKQS
jgi:hypothetical protein